jgi:D-psicose/D-tagatose/L-ribulose 3-epimerase
MSVSRRSLLLGAAAPLLQGAGALRFSICSETFAGMNFEDACRAARRIGYQGIEIEPAHLGADPAALSRERRAELRRLMQSHGLQYIGLHSLLKMPPGLHLTTADGAIRQKSWDYFARLIDLAADLGDRPVMVLGSSKQRAAMGGVTPADAVRAVTEGLFRMAAVAVIRGVTILVEPLASHLCNVINTLEEAMKVVRTVNSPAIATMFDTHNTAAEQGTPVDLIRQYLPYIRHVHLNEMDGRRPGAADYPFEIVMRALRQGGYRHWISVEVFDFKPDGETVARQALEFLRHVKYRS